MNEKLIEKKLREGVKKLGGLALKWVSPSFVGVPDRIVLMPTGRVWFVEIKTTGKKPTALQVAAHNKLRDLGHVVRVIDNQEVLTAFLTDIAK